MTTFAFYRIWDNDRNRWVPFHPVKTQFYTLESACTFVDNGRKGHGAHMTVIECWGPSYTERAVYETLPVIGNNCQSNIYKEQLS